MQPPRTPPPARAGDDDALALPRIALPEGGGAVRGIEEKFRANPATGTASFTVPLPVSPARQGASPALALGYDSGAGNGPFGLGWRVAIPSIVRRTEKRLPRYRDDDVFQLAGAEDLTPRLVPDGDGWALDETTRADDDGATYRVRAYRPRIEGAFARIERWTRDGDGDVHWRTTSADNVRALFGRTPGARLADPHDPRRVFEWLLELALDDRGNCTTYAYKAEDLVGVPADAPHERNRLAGEAAVANRYPKSVRYGNVTPCLTPQAVPNDFLFENVFDYGEHDAADPRPDDDAPWALRPDPFSTHRAGFEVRTYRRCRRVLLFHHIDALGPAPTLVRATELTYDAASGFSLLREVGQRGYLRDADGALSSRALPPLAFTYAPLAWDATVHEVGRDALADAPAALADARAQYVDLYGEGVAGILAEHGTGWHYKRNLGDGAFAPAEPVAPKPSFRGLTDGTLALLDVDADGRLAAVQLDAAPQGFFRAGEGEAWEPFAAFRQVPNVAAPGPHARWIDLNGDGRPELVVDEDSAFAWYAWEGADGFAPAERAAKPFDEERGPAVVFADAAQTIFLADMNGDGLADVVRVRNGEIAYWPNEGYGRFGAKVTMSDAPTLDHPDHFDPRRVRLTDVDGSGPADLLYVGADAVRVWRNLSGNAWTPAPVALDPLAPNAPATDVRVVDLLGDGTACVVWSSPLPADAAAPMRYVDLLGGRKPHLLVGFANNAGREVALRYRSSARFYLDDRAAGTPWATRLPFPVYCLHRVETWDRVRGSYFASEFRYRHGHYDRAEREFRGFGRVDQLDTETFEHFALSGGTNVVEAPLYQAPVLTRRWYHTGAADDARAQLALEFYDDAAFSEHVPAEPPLPDGLSPEEMVEARRACKGLPLREESYALDGSPTEPLPYATATSTCRVRMVQPRRDGQYASFLVTPAESIAHHYERVPADPRVAHDVVLATDALGRVLRSAAIVYPRQAPDTTLPPEVQADQARRVVTVAEIAYTNDVVDATTHRLRVPCEQRRWELTGAAPAAGGRFTPAEIDAAWGAAAEIPFEATASAGVERRLLAHARVYGLADDLSGPLPLGTLGARGLVHRALRLAYTPGLVAEAFGPRADDATLLAAGYVHAEGDAQWWVPSPTAVYAADAADHFWLPTGTRDPFGTVTATVGYDAFDLLPEWSEDALGNRSEAVNDYRVLAPVQATDPNGERAAVRVDELGVVVATAVLGRAGLGEGDTLDDPTVRIEYDADAWRLTGRPNVVRAFARERHGAANPRWRESRVYADGSGGVVMTKTQAEPGVARRFDPAAGVVVEEDTSPNVRWVGTGRTVVNNKGNPVKRYEPYFSVTPEFEDEAALVETGITPVLTYDPLGRVVRSDLPDGTFATTTFGPWSQVSRDVNDTVRDSRWYADRGAPDPDGAEPADPRARAAWLAARHADTPTAVHTDALGRTIYAVSDNGPRGRYGFRTRADVTGHRSTVHDPLGRAVAGGVANLLGAPCRAWSADKGERRFLHDALGAVVRTWDGDDRDVRVTYDALHRPVTTFLRGADGGEAAVQHHVYGESHPAADARRLRARLWRVYDQGGEVTLDGFALGGHPVAAARRLAADYRGTIDWSPLVGQAPAALDAVAAPLLEAESYAVSADYDALHRPVETRLGDGTRIRRAYNEAGVLDSLVARVRDAGPWVTVLANQDYDAAGRRQRADFGNGTRTTFEYEPDTHRLARLLTRRLADGATLQDLRYTYDPSGNVTRRADEAQQALFFANAVVDAASDYEYDAIYQLVRATGREHATGVPPGEADVALNPLPHPNDATAVRRYVQSYEHDALGNLLAVRHVAAGGSWTRRYRYAYQDDPADRTNRLAATSLPGDAPDGPYSAAYAHDAHGNMSAMPHLASMRWDFVDQLREADLGGGGTAYFVYDGAGRRVRKVVERPNGMVLDRAYVGGVEVYRERSLGTTRLERQTVHLADDVARVAQADTTTIDLDDPTAAGATALRFVHGDLLGSAVLQTDETGGVVAYEEHHPFGGTAYRSGRSALEAGLRRYRFLGHERDDETGLYALGARHYAAWLGRWTGADPAGFTDGVNLYRYALNNPVRFSDPAGTQPVDPSEVQVVQRHEFTGAESYEEIHGMAPPPGYEWDPAVTPENFQNFYVPGPGDTGEGGTWAVLRRVQPPAPEPAPEPEPPPDAGGSGEGGAGAGGPGPGDDGGGSGAPGTFTPEEPESRGGFIPPVVAGGLQVIGGGIEIFLGGVAVAGSEFTFGASAILGYALIVHGADTAGHGIATIATDEVQQTYTFQAAESGGQALGMEPDTARYFATGVDIAAGMGPSIGLGMVRGSATAAADSTMLFAYRTGSVSRAAAEGNPIFLTGHNMVGASTQGTSQWYHLAGLPEATFSSVSHGPNPSYFITRIPVSAERAGSAIMFAESKTFSSAQTWRWLGPNCTTAAREVLQAGGVTTSSWARTPLALQMDIAFRYGETVPLYVVPVTTASAGSAPLIVIQQAPTGGLGVRTSF